MASAIGKRRILTGEDDRAGLWLLDSLTDQCGVL